ncbi:MAG: XrtA/PEP-CTERM system exopolysaccharide export protein [Burkholderiales bacterium]
MLIALSFLLALGACAGRSGLPPAPAGTPATPLTYRIGPGDNLRIFVWGNPGLSDIVPVRPDGRISIPLIEDLEVTDKTPTEVGREIEKRLANYVQDPLVTVIVTGFVGPFTQQVRVVGQAAEPRAIPYRVSLTALDVMIEVGGLTEFAAGNRTTLVRQEGNEQRQYRIRLDDLIKDGDISANVAMQPGDVLIIPESFF